MKKRCITLLLACVLLLPIVASAQDYVSIEELGKQPPARWTQTYETKWRTVEIDVLPTMQQVNKVPILKVGIDFWLPDVSALGEEWTSSLFWTGVFNASRNDLNSMQAKNMVTKRFSPPYDPDKKYGENTDLSFGDVLSYLEATLISIDLPTDMWWFDKPYQLFVNSILHDQTGEPIYPDIYTTSLCQKINGIPLICHVLNSGKSRDDEIWVAPTGISFCIATPNIFEIGGQKFSVVEVVANDVPLSDFSIIRSAIEKEIIAGHIRKIFDIDFGYTLYNDASVSFGEDYLETATFYAVPVWRVNCYYIESGKKEMRDYTGKDVPERGVQEYMEIIINAQTGEMRDLSDNRKGCGDYRGFISWEEVGGKP